VLIRPPFSLVDCCGEAVSCVVKMIETAGIGVRTAVAVVAAIPLRILCRGVPHFSACRKCAFDHIKSLICAPLCSEL